MALPTSSSLALPSLSAAEFATAVLHPEAKTAVFDCDGTLWSGDAGSGFMRWTIETGLVSRETVDAMDGRYRGYLRGEVSELAICGEMVQMYQGLREAEMEHAAQTYVEAQVKQRVFAELRDVIARLQAAGTEIWAVSSTNRWVIEQGVREFGIPVERILAASVRVVDGVLGNELIDVPTDEGKAVALREVGLGSPDLVFGNSVHDAAMLEMADRPFAVNPTPALSVLATERGWPMFAPAGSGAAQG